MKKKTREQLIIAAPAGIAAAIAVGATVHTNGQLRATKAIQQQLLGVFEASVQPGAIRENLKPETTQNRQIKAIILGS